MLKTGYSHACMYVYPCMHVWYESWEYKKQLSVWILRTLSCLASEWGRSLTVQTPRAQLDWGYKLRRENQDTPNILKTILHSSKSQRGQCVRISMPLTHPIITKDSGNNNWEINTPIMSDSLRTASLCRAVQGNRYKIYESYSPSISVDTVMLLIVPASILVIVKPIVSSIYHQWAAPLIDCIG